MIQVVLASASPRRKELLEQVGVEFSVWPAKGEEHCEKKTPHETVLELSGQKAREVAGSLLHYNEMHGELVTPQDLLVIGADTVVACGGAILGKPKDEADAVRMLRLLSGQTHSVYTGVTLVLIDKSGRAGERAFYEKTDVCMYEMSEAEIARYVATKEPMDKAGAYAIQGRCAIHIRRITGDYNNVVGLPVAAIYQELTKLGIDLYNRE